MTYAKARFALLAVLALGAVGALVPAQASAVVSYYDCVLKPVGDWCDGRANGSFDGLNSWDYNYGWYPGAWDGSVVICQQVYKPATGLPLAGGSCHENYADADYGNVQCVCYEAEVRQYSGGPHSVNGFADSE